MSIFEHEPTLPVSILDTDLYKLTMQQAVFEHYSTTHAKYQFTNRRKTDKFPRETYAWIREMITKLEDIKLTKDERTWLEKRFPYFKPAYLDFLEAFRFKPSEQIRISYEVNQTDANGKELGDIKLDIEGLWVETILYEVPIMSLISQGYFLHCDTSWDYVGQIQNAHDKLRDLMAAGCVITEFGTRRRRTYLGHKLVLQGLVDAHKEYSGKDGYKGKLNGTSNVHFAHMFDIPPIGTIAHEWIMGVAAMEGYEGSNGLAMDKWDQTYPSGELTIALTDTFSSKPFFKDLKANPERARRWIGLRQDSGDPKIFAEQAKAVYDELGIDARKKFVVFSDSLTPERVLDLKKHSDSIGIGCSFGVGTNLTNDFKTLDKPEYQSADAVGKGKAADASLPESKALNMVIKLWFLDTKPCIKISDDLTKNSGDPEAVRLVKMRFGLE